MRINYGATDYGRGPKCVFISHNGHSVSLREFFRHPIKAWRVLAGKGGTYAS